MVEVSNIIHASTFLWQPNCVHQSCEHINKGNHYHVILNVVYYIKSDVCMSKVYHGGIMAITCTVGLQRKYPNHGTNRPNNSNNWFMIIIQAYGDSFIEILIIDIYSTVQEHLVARFHILIPIQCFTILHQSKNAK